MMKSKNKKAFTLSEVLITLTIIGIIASLVISNIYKSYQKFLIVTRLKIAYSTLSEALRQAEAEKGPAETWSWSLTGVQMASEYILPYLSWSEFSPSIIKRGNSNGYNIRGIRGEYNSLNGSLNWALNNSSNAKWVQLKNGMTLIMIKGSHGWHNQGLQLWVDTNGYNKGPNIVGKDIFIFGIKTSSSDCNKANTVYTNVRAVFEPGVSSCIMDKNLATAADNYTINSKLNDTTKGNCNLNAPTSNNMPTGTWCSYVIYKNGWKIPNGYPIK